MSDIVISVESLWKKYRLGVVGTGTLRHDLNRWWHQVRGKPDPYAIVGQKEKAEGGKLKAESPNPQPSGFTFQPSSLSSDEIWALRDISFQVKRGEILGIIGCNGAGKSTLLKILSRVTAPTSGEVKVKGRIASLLEVGTGFHPELTGRENIFLNGAVLGMTKAEIRRKLDEIIAFAEVEKYIDTPVKRYSSGMYVRLAFAVAAHLDPEILIVDEVLAVGDAAFQKKCLGKMGEVARSGRTVLFVSHNTGTISALCESVLVLSAGEMAFAGSAEGGVRFYLEQAEGKQDTKRSRVFDLDDSLPMQVLEVCLGGRKGDSQSLFDIKDDICIAMRYRVRSPLQGASPAFWVSRNGVELLCSFESDKGRLDSFSLVPGDYHVRAVLRGGLLKAGHYSVTVGTGQVGRGPFDTHRDVMSFQVEALSEDTCSKGYDQKRGGVIIAPVIWGNADNAIGSV
jgi:lipopolysaccharide transport system ATP-binding protein